MRARTLRLVPSTDLVSLDPVISTALVAVRRRITSSTRSWRGRVMRAAANGRGPSGSRRWPHRRRPSRRARLLFQRRQLVRSREPRGGAQALEPADSFGRPALPPSMPSSSPDDRRLVIRLKRPFPRLADALAAPQPATCARAHHPRKGDSPSITEVIGSGPGQAFLREEWSSCASGRLWAACRLPAAA